MGWNSLWNGFLIFKQLSFVRLFFLNCHKVEVFWGGHMKSSSFLVFLRTVIKKREGDLVKFCSLLSIYELYHRIINAYWKYLVKTLKLRMRLHEEFQHIVDLHHFIPNKSWHWQITMLSFLNPNNFFQFES